METGQKVYCNIQKEDDKRFEIRYYELEYVNSTNIYSRPPIRHYVNHFRKESDMYSMCVYIYTFLCINMQIVKSLQLFK